MFTARRKPKKVVTSDTRDEVSNQHDEESGPVVRRPNAAPKTKSRLRISFDPAAESTADEQTFTTDALSKPAHLAASVLSRNPTVAAPQRERDRDEPERPSYSKSYLDELKGSTPSTPKDLSLYNSSTEDELPLTTQTRALDIASKFGSSALNPLASAIPSAAEIQEKKDRRLRLAREQQADALGSSTNKRNGGSINNNDDFVSLDAYDSDGEFKPSRLQVSAHLHNDRLENAQEYTRLIPEDEDIAEGFDQFVDDDHEKIAKSGRIQMGMKTNEAIERQRIRSMIRDAEGATDSDEDSEDSDGSDASAEHAYIAAQTSHGVGFSHLTKEQRRRHEKDARRPRQPEKTTPIPTLAAGLARLRELQSSSELNRVRAEARKAEIVRRLESVEEEKGRIQRALEELGGQLEATSGRVAAQTPNGEGSRVRQGGLDDIGAQT